MITDKSFMNIAHIIAEHSSCQRAKVGAIIVKDNSILSIGYNGTPHHWNNKCEENGVTKPEVIHAEANAILRCARHGMSSKGTTMYCTHACCTECAKMIIQSGISTFIYDKNYRDEKGIQLLQKADIDVYCTGI